MGKPEKICNLEDLVVDGMIILKWILKKQDVGAQTDSFGVEQGQKAGSCEHGNELCYKVGKFFTTEETLPSQSSAA